MNRELERLLLRSRDDLLQMAKLLTQTANRIERTVNSNRMVNSVEQTNAYETSDSDEISLGIGENSESSSESSEDDDGSSENFEEDEIAVFDVYGQGETMADIDESDMSIDDGTESYSDVTSFEMTSDSYNVTDSSEF